MSHACEAYELLISRVIDGELSSAEEDALREHLRSCPDCRAVAVTFAGLSRSLREDLAEPPAELFDGVMDRIRGDESEPEPPRRAAPRPKRLWPKVLIAASLALVIGIGGFAALTGRGRPNAAAETAEEAPAAAERYAPAEAAEEPMAPMPEAAPLPDANAGYGDAAPFAAEAAEADATAADRDMPEEDAGAGLTAEEAAALFTLDTPAAVPAGRESDFDALVKSAGPGDSGARFIFAYVEYRGVIYEFSMGDAGELIWRDAAEGMPALSPGTVEDLLKILQ